MWTKDLGGCGSGAEATPIGISYRAATKSSGAIRSPKEAVWVGIAGMLVQNATRFFEPRADRRSDQLLTAGHNPFD